MKYTVVFEKAEGNFAAYVPDLPGCIATGLTRDEVETHIREAIALHIKAIREEGSPPPEPEAWAELVEA